jgi:hypothetical protein
MPLSNEAPIKELKSESYFYGFDKDKEDALFSASKIFEILSSNSEIFTFIQRENNDVTQAINTQNPFEILNPSNSLFRIIERGVPQRTKIYKLITKTNRSQLTIGIYGNGGLEIKKENLLLIYMSGVSVNSVLQDENTVIYNFQDIGSTSLIDHINSLSESIIIDDSGVISTVFQVLIRGEVVHFLYKGSEGDYSLNGTNITEDNLELLPNEYDDSGFVAKQKTTVTTYLFEESNKNIAPLFTSNSAISCVVKSNTPIGTKFLFARWGTGEVSFRGQDEDNDNVENPVILRFPEGKLLSIASRYSWVELEVIGVNEVAVRGDLKSA